MFENLESLLKMRKHDNECSKQPDLMQQKKKTQQFDSKRLD